MFPLDQRGFEVLMLQYRAYNIKASSLQIQPPLTAPDRIDRWLYSQATKHAPVRNSYSVIKTIQFPLEPKFYIVMTKWLKVFARVCEGLPLELRASCYVLKFLVKYLHKKI